MPGMPNFGLTLALELELATRTIAWAAPSAVWAARPIAWAARSDPAAAEAGGGALASCVALEEKRLEVDRYRFIPVSK